LHKARRDLIMELARKSSGHLSAKKFLTIMKKTVGVPNLGRGVTNYCRACVECQRFKKSRPKKTPLVVRPALA